MAALFQNLLNTLDRQDKTLRPLFLCIIYGGQARPPSLQEDVHIFTGGLPGGMAGPLFLDAYRILWYLSIIVAFTNSLKMPTELLN